MCFRSLIRATIRRRRSADPIDVNLVPPVIGPSSIEYRESHRGFLLRVSANSAGLFSLFIEDPHGLEPCPLQSLPDADHPFPPDGFRDLVEAIAAVPAAKVAIDACLNGKRAS
ncbi:hypothetical protein AWB83_06821 [Caballeronia ptereochthonis]|uniref:Uncharacterized protein n=2 Tax=Caballeronia ptereochthonis TaxID=1777144 RepID=A0A158E9G6_9BURK|nr:hypothetical protein AWB83_06821 [Caballeronia ptereochthonis]